MYSRSPLLEIDISMTKSTASFITDAGVARGHVLERLIGLDTIGKPPPRLVSAGRGASHEAPAQKLLASEMAKCRDDTQANVPPLSWSVAGVHATFYREIKPYQRYEVWTRVLAWDDEQLYIASWFVRSGTFEGATKHVALMGEHGGQNEEVFGSVEARESVIAVVVSRTAIRSGSTVVRPVDIWSHRWLMGPDVEQHYGRRSAEILKAMRSGDEVGLMDLWVETVVSGGSIQILGEYSDIWSWCW
jgi:hypothetical protein